MTRIERRLLIRSSLLGFLLTLVVLAADWQGKDGLLWRIENNLYDLRARKFQYFTPPPTDKLVHIDIDDPSLQYMGQWPWPRTLLAELTDAMREAGAKAIAFDVLFAEAERPSIRRVKVMAAEKRADAAGGADRPAALKETEVLEEVDGNAEFAAALRRFGAVVLPASYEPRQPATALGTAIYDALYADLLRSNDDVKAIVAGLGVEIDDLGRFNTLFNRALKEAMFDRVIRLLELRVGTAASGGAAVPSREEVGELLFPGKEARLKRDFPPGLFRQQYERAVAFHELRRFARPLPPGLPPFMPAVPDLPPIPMFSAAVGGSSFVNYLADGDGVVRAVELWREWDGWLYPQFGLMLACAYLNVDIGSIELHADHIIIPKPDGTRLRVPVFAQYVNPVGQTCSMYTPVAWFGPSDRDDAWMRMYDYPRHADAVQHLPMVKVWEALEFRNRIRANTAQMRKAIAIVLELTHETRINEFAAMKLDTDDLSTHIKLLDETIARRDEIDFVIEGADQLPPAQLEAWLQALPDDDRENMRHFVEALHVLPRLREDSLQLAATLARVRTNLHALLNNKALIVGFTAVGRLDVVPTSMIAQCPGPVVHGVIFNSLLTGDVWARSSPWVTRLFTLLVGLVATAAVAYFHPFNALLSSIIIALGYLAFNFLYLFDYSNLIVGAAAPLVSVGLVWSGCTLMRFIVERAERRHIENRFRSYVDPALVNAIIEHPEKVHFEGESREMTVVFTDLAGFTTLSEKLKERTVPILNEYMRRMVAIIRDNRRPEHRRGYRNKFLGDGIMFFFGAPLDNATHAIDAVATVLHMQEAMPLFNDWLKEQDLPSVKMRAGISTGSMIVGDAGSPDAADYTVLGDDVNFGARLESANKAVGTLVMISQRTKELSDAVFLCRPIARLQVVGKTQGIKVYEPLCFHENATEVHKSLAKASEGLVEAFARGAFAECLKFVSTIEELFGASKLTALYRRECERYIAEPPGEAFDGTIVLAEK